MVWPVLVQVWHSMSWLCHFNYQDINDAVSFSWLLKLVPNLKKDSMTDNEFWRFSGFCILSQKLKMYSFAFLIHFPEITKARISFCFVYKGKSETPMSPHKIICKEVYKTVALQASLHFTVALKHVMFLTFYILKLVVLTSVGRTRDNNASWRAYR